MNEKSISYDEIISSRVCNFCGGDLGYYLGVVRCVDDYHITICIDCGRLFLKNYSYKRSLNDEQKNKHFNRLRSIKE